MRQKIGLLVAFLALFTPPMMAQEEIGDEKALGYVPTLDASYCQRCYRIRHYGDVTINMQQGIESNATLEKINKIDGVVFWVVDLFAFEANLISRLNQKLPGKDIVMVLMI